jgi:hypothetical protein
MAKKRLGNEAILALAKRTQLARHACERALLELRRVLPIGCRVAFYRGDKRHGGTVDGHYASGDRQYVRVRPDDPTVLPQLDIIAGRKSTEMMISSLFFE